MVSSVPKNVAPHRKEAAIAAAAAATTTASPGNKVRKPVKRKKKFGLQDKKKVPVEE